MQLMHHQSRFVEVCREHRRYGWWADCGVGKTIGMLAVCADQPMRTLVICPKSIMRAAWQNDARHFPNMKVVIAWSNKKKEREQLIREPADVTVTNFDTFRNSFASFVNAGFRRFIIDESSGVKNFKAKLTKRCVEFADRMESVYLLSGTPAPNSETEYWPQFRCIDPTVFGRSYYRFCGFYFKELKKQYGNNIYHAGWQLLDSRKAEFEKRLASKSWSLRKEDAVNLPEQIDVVREVDLSPDERRQYNTMRRELEIELEGETHVANPNARTMKLRQITGGSYYGGDCVHAVGDAKLNELADVLDEIGRRKVVIWAEFTSDIDRICGALEKKYGPAAYVRMDGQTKDTANAVRLFQADPVIRYAVCQPQTAGHGVTMTAASYAVYYSLSFSYEYHKQSRDRIHRTGQTQPCTYIYLIARETIDGQILECLQKKKDAHSAIMDALCNTKGKGNAARIAIETS